jgi:gliding motility-associated-like protein
VWSAESTPTGGYWQWVWQGDTTQQTLLGETLTWNMEGMNIVSVTYYANGCVSNTQTTTVTILQCPETLIWIPNTFTPDGNEWNNVWQPVFTSGFDPAEFSLFVMNRWGETVWESRDATVAWDGTYNGKLCQDGVYFYMITYGDPDNDRRSTIQGHITLIR